MLSDVIERTAHRRRVEALLRQFPVVAILGARQVGKTTLAHSLAAGREGATFFDLESVEDLALLQDPLLTLRPLRGLVIVDEVPPRLRVQAKHIPDDHAIDARRHGRPAPAEAVGRPRRRAWLRSDSSYSGGAAGSAPRRAGAPE
jgi:hypothetical protein